MSNGKSAANRLLRETSPYLRQHADNPVAWHPWGEEALARARDEDKPILLSIGYSACHWCHVMAHESFEDPAIAAQMNAHFVCIKVDREERPDLDDIYMAATVAMTGQGGWPMTVFLLPDQRPFFAGTYFPPTDRYGRPGFPRLLGRIAELWKEDRAGIEAQAATLTDSVRGRLEVTAPAPGDLVLVAKAAAQLATEYDAVHGGFGTAPKFPPCPALRLLLRHHAQSADPDALRMVRGTLDAMAKGGIYDHLSGGFARYSTDERWQVPHFEKMLYDNAQLARVYVEAYQLTQDDRYACIARETLDYLVREMQSPAGGFYSATDADSEGVEGKFFTFTHAELTALLQSPEREAFFAFYDIREPGNWEHTNVLWTPRSAQEVAAELGISPVLLATHVADAKRQVRAYRAERVAPACDDKILVSWNGLTISALAEAARAFDETRYADAAERAVAHIASQLTRPDGGLYRTARGERAHLAGYLEDYAFLAEGLLTLYEATGNVAHRAFADRLCTRIVKDFFDDAAGTFFQTAHSHETLLARPRDAQDDALPNASAIAAHTCARVAVLNDRPDLRAVAERVTQSLGALLARAPRAFPSMLSAAEFLAAGPTELSVVGSPEDPRTRALLRVLGRTYLAQRVIAHGTGDLAADAPGEPMLRGKCTANGAPAVYLCRHQTCSRPLTEPAELERALLSP